MSSLPNEDDDDTWKFPLENPLIPLSLKQDDSSETEVNQEACTSRTATDFLTLPTNISPGEQCPVPLNQTQQLAGDSASTDAREHYIPPNQTQQPAADSASADAREHYIPPNQTQQPAADSASADEREQPNIPLNNQTQQPATDSASAGARQIGLEKGTNNADEVASAGNSGDEPSEAVGAKRKRGGAKRKRGGAKRKRG